MNSLRIAFTGALLAATQLCFAWCEDGHPSVKQETKDSRYVFVAQVEQSRDVIGPGNLIDGTYFTLRVTENLKGHPELRVEVFSENTTARFPMDVGASYLLFVDRQRSEVTNSSEFVIDSCGNSGLAKTQQKVLAQVRKAADPEEHYFRYPPKLKEAQVVAIAKRAAQRNGRVLAEYEFEEANYNDRERRWSFSGWGKDRAIGNHFLVSVSDRTGAYRFTAGL